MACSSPHEPNPVFLHIIRQFALYRANHQGFLHGFDASKVTQSLLYSLDQVDHPPLLVWPQGREPFNLLNYFHNY